MHFLASVFTGFALGAGSFLGLFHHPGVASSTPPYGPRYPVISTTTPGMGNMHPGQGGYMASSTVSVATITCVGSAVSAREQALDTAEVSLNTALANAYSTRSAALSAAYSLTTGDAVKSAVQGAWQAFASATQSARNSWRNARTSAWQSFMTGAKTCKAPPSVLDTNDSQLEVSGD